MSEFKFIPKKFLEKTELMGIETLTSLEIAYQLRRIADRLDNELFVRTPNYAGA